MKLIIEKNNSDLIIKFKGNLDSLNSNQTAKELNESLQGIDAAAVYLDLTRVEFISSMGIRILISAQNVCNQQGISLALYGLSSALNKVFDQAGLFKKFKIYASKVDAFKK